VASPKSSDSTLAINPATSADAAILVELRKAQLFPVLIMKVYTGLLEYIHPGELCQITLLTSE
jgi:hypothetical protein